MDIKKITQMQDQPVEYWRTQCLNYWHLHFVNQKVIRHLTSANKQLQRPLRRFQLEAGNYQRMYEMNIKMVKALRRQNRMLRQLLDEKWQHPPKTSNN